MLISSGRGLSWWPVLRTYLSFWGVTYFTQQDYNMLTLHGFPYSNYYNMVKHALLLKGVPFSENSVYTSSPELVALSPVEKVPVLTLESGENLSESSVLLDYLEDAYPDTPLYPSDALARARVRRLMKISELYLDLPARRLLPGLFGNVAVDESVKGEVRATFDKAIRSIATLASFSPYVAGDTLTLADICLRYALVIPKMVGPRFLDWDPAAELEALQKWEALMADSDVSRKVDADHRGNEAEFMARITGG
jgi:glutathione S-transferase